MELEVFLEDKLLRNLEIQCDPLGMIVTSVIHLKFIFDGTIPSRVGSVIVE